MAAQPERWVDEDRADDRREKAGKENGDDDRKVEVERDQRRRISSDGEQSRLAERNLPSSPGDQGEAQRQHSGKPGVSEGLQEIGLRIDERQGRRRQRQAPQDRRRDANRTGRRKEGASQGLGMHTASSEYAIGLQHQRADQQDEGEEVAISRAEERDPVAFRKTEDEAPENRARHVSDAADHSRDDALQHGVEAHAGIEDVVVVHPDQKAASSPRAPRPRRKRHRSPRRCRRPSARRLPGPARSRVPPSQAFV